MSNTNFHNPEAHVMGFTFNSKQNTITSLELLKQINFFRSQSNETKSQLRHDTLMTIIRNEFEEEIGIQKLLETPYTHKQNGQSYLMFNLTLSQAKQVLVRESRFVRKAVIAYIEELETKSKPKSLADLLIEAGETIKEKERIIDYQKNQISNQNKTNYKIINQKAKETKTGILAVKCDLGVEINALVNAIYYKISNFRDRFLTARQDYYNQTGQKYLGARESSLDSKKNFLEWLKSL